MVWIEPVYPEAHETSVKVGFEQSTESHPPIVADSLVYENPSGAEVGNVQIVTTHPVNVTSLEMVEQGEISGIPEYPSAH